MHSPHGLNMAHAFQRKQMRSVENKTKKSFIYRLNNKPLKEENEQKDLGIIVSNDLKPRKHVLGVWTKGNRISGLIKRCFTKLDKNKISTLYKSIVRPILEYGYVVWSPWTVQDKHTLEREQRRFIGLANEDISLPSLEDKRNDTYLSETYKLLNDDYKLKSEKFFQTNVNNLRGHSKDIFKPQSNIDHYTYFYTRRMVEPWNKLPDEVVCDKTLSNFRTKYVQSRTDR